MISAQRLQRALESILADHPELPGILMRVEADDEVAIGATGLANRQTKEPMLPGHAFRIASNTKTFVATATLRLCEGAVIYLDQPIDELLPDSVRKVLDRHYDLEAITVRHLLQHTSGISNHFQDGAGESAHSSYLDAAQADPQHPWTPLEQIDFAVERFPPTGRPGSDVVYSDTGYVVVGQILEFATGAPLPAVLRRECRFDELGLVSTWTELLEPAPAAADAMAHVYRHGQDWTGVHCSVDLYGGGGLVSTAEDLVRFWRALFGGEVFAYEETLNTMLSTRPGGDGAWHMGLGMMRQRIGSREWWAHGGYWGSLVVHDRERHLTAVVFANEAMFGRDMIAGLLDSL